MAGQKIRIRLKAYDHEVIDYLGEEDRRHGDPHWCEGRRPGAAAH
jgi:ribosomal protein S10